MHNQHLPTIVTTAAAAAGVVGAGYYAYKLYREARPKLPEEWQLVGNIKDIYAYPIKSCGPVLLTKAECSTLGLKDGWLRDRFLMIVDAKNNFVSARAYPELLTVQPTVRNSVLTLQHKVMETIHINLAEVVALQKSKTATVWGIEVPVLDCGWEVSEWFSRFLNKTTDSYRLVYYASQSSRKLRPTANSIYKFTKNDTGALPDEVPFNLINEASIADLNTRLTEHKVTHRNFRPNFVLTGTAAAYDEDRWKFVKIGENVFEIIKPCYRCIMTTIDPETGVRNTKPEPLDTLKTYRQSDNPEERKSAGISPRMGIQMSLRTPSSGGIVSLNDPVYVAM